LSHLGEACSLGRENQCPPLFVHTTDAHTTNPKVKRHTYHITVAYNIQNHTIAAEQMDPSFPYLEGFSRRIRDQTWLVQ